MSDPTKNGPKPGSEATQFKPGNPGGPGRPAGSRNAATLALDAIGNEAAEEVLGKLVEAAKGGDLRAAEILLSRVWPVRKGRSVVLDLPAMESAADVVKALSVVAAEMASGNITPEEAQAVAAVLEGKRRAVETVALEARIAALEEERSDESAR
jgi:hypothetical protein